MLNIGIIVNNRYRIVKLLGQGGFGAVYRAWDINLNHACALKLNLDTSAEAQRQFQREASTLAALSHPNLPRVTDHFFVQGQGQFLIMDYVDGEDLETTLVREGRLSPERALAIITQVADALAYLHQQNPPIIHRDIKPANIRITPDGRVFLVDFGLVKVYDQQLRTTIGARAVTPGYSPPEQYGQGNTDARTDLYALAATLYKMLTGEEPQESVQRIVEDKLRPAIQVNPAVSRPMSAAVLQAMSLNPSQRYQNVGVFMRSLQQIAPAAGTNASPIKSPVPIGNTTSTTPHLPGSRTKPVWWMLGTTVLLSAFFFLFILPNTRQQATQQLALQITQQTNSTRLAQTGIARTVQAAETSTAEQVGRATSIAAQATDTAQSITQAFITARAVMQATDTARAEAVSNQQAAQTATAVSARATAAARGTATQQASYASATATVRARNNTIATLEAQAPRVFGPINGVLVHYEDDLVEADYADVTLKNFIAEASFVNPYNSSTGSWDYGFLFRHSGFNNQFRLSIHSDKSWVLGNRSNDEWDIINSGTISHLLVTTGQRNEIRLICLNEQGWLYVNDRFIAELDLSSRTSSGDIRIATGIYNGDEIAGEETRYNNFTVWSLPSP